MLKPTKILIIEDLPSDAELAQRELKKHLGDCHFTVVETKSDYLEALETFEPDLIVSDYNLPSFDGLTALKLCLQQKPQTPFIILTGSMNEDTAVECMKAGAWDYVIKEHNKRLGASAISALEKSKSLEEKAIIVKANEENQIFIQQITETVPLFILIYDLSEKKTTYSNRSVAKELGYDPANVVTSERETLVELIHPDDATKFFETQQRLYKLKDRESEECEYRIQNAKAEWIWFHSRYVVFSREENGTPKLILVAAENVSDLKSSQAELRMAHQFYKQILSSAQDGIMVTNMEDKIVFWNPMMENIYGIYQKEALGMNLVQLFNQRNQDNAIGDYNEAKNGSFTISADFEFNVEKTGSKGWAKIQYIPLIDIDNDVSGVICMINDITDRKRDEEELRESEHKYKTIFENIQDVYFETELDGTIVEVSPSISSISKYVREDMIGTNILNVYANTAEREEIITKLTTGHTLKDYELQLLDKDKSVVECAVSAQILRDTKEQKPHIYGIMRDISDRKKIMNELIEAKDKAEEMSKLKSAFLANMSHELRTPLVGILGFAELLFDMVPNSEIKEMVGTILESGERLHNTLNLILDLSRVEANRQELKWTEVDFVSVIKENCKLYLPLAMKKNINLDFLYDEDELICLSDRNLLGNIFSNVINNAVKYTNAGFVKVTLKKEHRNDEELIVVQIIDTGIGIHESRKELIFDAFRQASEGYQRIYEGTGLGLTITKKYVELLNGTISLTSAIDKGSVFEVSFPFNTEIKESIDGK